LSNRG